MTKEIPIDNWSEAGKYGGVGKVIQLYVDDKPYLRFRGHESDTSKISHGKMLRDILDEMNIPYETVMDKTRKDLPAPTGQRYRVVGVGYYILTGVGGFHLLSDKNTDYNMGIDKKHLEEIIRLSLEWTFKSE